MSVRVTSADGIGELVLDDPPLNILTQEMMRELRLGLEALAREDRLRVVLLRAEGSHFSAGASVEEHLPDQVSAMIPDFVRTVRAVRRFPLPVVAAVQGRCLGGAFELIMAADLIVAAESARLGVPEIRLGVFPPVACVQLSTSGSPALMTELIYTGDPQPAPAMAAAGLILRSVPDGALGDEALDLARRIARNSGAALRMTKRALMAVTSRQDAALDPVCQIYLDELMATADAVEGLTSFMEKRTPEWSHR